MITSMITSKGQTTIPREVREALHIGVSDRLLYEVDGDRVVIHPLKGDVFSLRGSIPARRKAESAASVRAVVRRSVAKRAQQRG